MSATYLLEATMDDLLGGKRTKERSPNFPFISVETALHRAMQFYEQEKRGEAPYIVAVQHWNYSPASSGGLQTIAALKHYSLMIDEGSGKARKVRLTDLALRILLDSRPDSTERCQYIRQAALAPSVIAEIYSKWPDGLPSEATINHYLLLDRGFSKDAAIRLSKILYENESFTTQYRNSSISDNVETVSDIYGNQSRAPSTEDAASLSSMSAQDSSVGVQQDVFTLEEGQVVMRWPKKLSAESFADFKDWIDLQVRKIARLNGVELKKKSGNEI